MIKRKTSKLFYLIPLMAILIIIPTVNATPTTQTWNIDKWDFTGLEYADLTDFNSDNYTIIIDFSSVIATNTTENNKFDITFSSTIGDSPLIQIEYTNITNKNAILRFAWMTNGTAGAFLVEELNNSNSSIILTNDGTTAKLYFGTTQVYQYAGSGHTINSIKIASGQPTPVSYSGNFNIRLSYYTANAITTSIMYLMIPLIVTIAVVGMIIKQIKY